jgi:phosphoglucomutase
LVLFMIVKNDIISTLDNMILSASGWRGVFALDGDEESTTKEISEAHKVICEAAAFVFADYLKIYDSHCKRLVFLGCDTRPTGKAIVDAMLPVLLAAGCDVRYAGVVAAPEIMAWARSMNNSGINCGFIYVSASHNPIGHNGLKFGLTDGGVLAADEANRLIANYRSFLDTGNSVPNGSMQTFQTPQNVEAAKSECFKAYYDFCSKVVWGDNAANAAAIIAAAMKNGLAKMPLGIVCDFNGSARTVSIDRDFFAAAGFKFECINDKPGQIAHRIVPEGESLEPCAKLLEDAHSRDASFVMGYVPDCDGDRGNLVIFDDTIGKARALEAQEVFALACIAEFAHLVWSGELPCKAAVAVNDPTSMRIDRIAEAFGVSVFRAEVGEANVVSLAKKLREEGYLVRILGEGSAGGNITHPSAVRDPINTVLAIAKMLLVRTAGGKSGLFEIWCKCSGQMEKYRDNFTLADIIASLPPFATTSVYNEYAVMRINAKDHSVLKDQYQEVFLQEWEERKNELKTHYDIQSWEAIAYNGMSERRGINRFGEAGRGGLKILFFDSNGREAAYIWMRGSATEPVFRIMADVCLNACKSNELERDLLYWQRRMIMKADID